MNNGGRSESIKIDRTLLIKDEGGRKAFSRYVIDDSKKPPIPESWDKDNFITWIICGEQGRNKELPKILNYWSMK